LSTPQHMVALAEANRVKRAAAAVRYEVVNGDLPIAAALEDERAQPMRIADLLCAQRGWSPRRTRELLGGLHIGELRRVRDLTARQRRILVAEMNTDSRERYRPRHDAA
jgi:hypothetical protein